MFHLDEWGRLRDQPLISTPTCLFLLPSFQRLIAKEEALRHAITHSLLHPHRTHPQVVNFYSLSPGIYERKFGLAIKYHEPTKCIICHNLISRFGYLNRVWRATGKFGVSFFGTSPMTGELSIEFNLKGFEFDLWLQLAGRAANWIH